MIIGIEATHANKKNRTGVEEVCFRLIEELKKNIPSTVKVVLYSNQPLIEDLKELPDNWELKILRWPFKKLWSQIRLSVEFLFHPPDIFFAPGQLIPVIVPKNTVVFVHDSAFEAHPSAYSFFGGLYLKGMNRLIVKKAKTIVTSTEFNKRELVKFYGEQAGHKTVVIPLAYTPVSLGGHQEEIISNIRERSLEILKKHNIKQPYILSVGRLEKKKNTRLIVKAYDKIRSEKFNFQSVENNLNLKPEIQLVLVGTPGRGYKEVQKALDNSPFKKDIILPGFVSAGDLSALYGLAEVFVFPSLYEGFGLPILESMANGCPVVTADIPALKEVGGEAVLCAKPEDSTDLAQKMTSLIFDTSLRQEKIKQGLERVTHFSWSLTGSRLGRVLELLKTS